MRHPHPAVIEARELIELEELHRGYPDPYRLKRAVDLAPTLNICEALLRNEAVPLDQLDQHYVRKYRLRRTA